MSTRPLHRPALETPSRYGGIAPLGLGLPGIKVDGVTYWEAKVRWMRGEQLSTEALSWIGVDGADRQRSGGWRQPAQMPAWSRTDDLDQYDEPTSIPMWLRPTTVAELEAET